MGPIVIWCQAPVSRSQLEVEDLRVRHSWVFFFWGGRGVCNDEKSDLVDYTVGICQFMVFFLEFWIEKMVRRVWVIVLAIKEGIILFVGAYDSDTIKGIREKKIL